MACIVLVYKVDLLLWGVRIFFLFRIFDEFFVVFYRNVEIIWNDGSFCLLIVRRKEYRY